MKRLALVALLACTPKPIQPPPVDVVVADAAPAPAPATVCGKACAHLAELGCSDGKAANCEAACISAPSSHVAAFDPACIIDAGTLDAAKACGVRCK